MARQSETRYAAYLHFLSTTDHRRDPAWVQILAGLAALRLVDAWADCDGHLPPRTGARLENEIDPIGAAEQAIRLTEPGTCLRRLLDDLLQSAAASVDRLDATVLVHALAYAEYLWRESRWVLAADAYRTVIRGARAPREIALTPRAHRQLGTCLRHQGFLDAALAEYALGRAAAHRCSDVETELRCRIGEAHVHSQLMQYDHADLLLCDVVRDAGEIGLPQVRARALHDRGYMAYQRKDLIHAVKFLHEAYREYDEPAQRERAVADLAVAMIAIGQLQAAREAFSRIHSESSDYDLRALAALNLLEIATLDNDREGFLRYRRELARTRLSEARAARYHLTIGIGQRRFGNEVLATAAFERAEEIAHHAQVMDVLSELAALRAQGVPQVRPSIDVTEIIQPAARELMVYGATRS